ncbi:MAG: MraY family glycosyltransferase [Bacteroidales bacterium]|nr:MraY family glycosyltransferase [Bacteroidales bacterium]HNW73950.1 MraY family glycosyltransferase [Bacteroidales bacterium]HPS50220.1 MraY family glycosyltransferase [Bacteroidales bacterium]
MSIFDLFPDFFSHAKADDMLISAAAFLTGFILCLVLIPVIIKLSARYNLVDKPNERKVHKIPISRLGGLGIVSGVLVTAPLWFLSGDKIMLIHFLLGMMLLIVIGVIDDLRELPPKIKLVGQIVAAVFLAHGGLRIDDFFGIFGIEHLPVIIQYLITAFIVAGVINAFNLIDGIDGLAGGLALIDMTGFFILFIIAGEYGLALIVASIAGSLLGFLKYNYHPAKIFMGDTGSMVLGYVLSGMGIMALVISRGPTSHFRYTEAAIMVFSIFLLPVYDTLRVFMERVLNKKSPFSPDKTHIHHLLMNTGFNHPKSAKILYTANIVIIMTGFFLRSQHMALVLPLLLLEALLFSESLTLYKLIKAGFRGRKLKNQSLRMQVDNRLIMDNLEEKDGTE